MSLLVLLLLLPETMTTDFGRGSAGADWFLRFFFALTHSKTQTINRVIIVLQKGPIYTQGACVREKKSKAHCVACRLVQEHTRFYRRPPNCHAMLAFLN